MVDISSALRLAADGLKDVTDESVGEAKIIVSYLCETEPSRLAFCDKQISLKSLRQIIARRRKGEPLQYILGKWWFYEDEFFVGKGVLIPRQDTETLVDTALELIKDRQGIEIADLCAGSGAIGISIANKRADVNVTAVEKYRKAFGFLKKNILHNKALNVNAVRADVMKKPFGMYDLIVSNPPYVTKQEMTALSAEVKREPREALLGGRDGLSFYRHISASWKTALKDGGILAFEIGKEQASSVEEILKNEGFTDITVRKDICGIQRVIFGTLKGI